MHVELCIPGPAPRRWHLDVVRRLAAKPGIDVGIRWAEKPPRRLPGCVDLLFALERLLHRLPAGGSEAIDVGDLAACAGSGGVGADVILDLAGGEPGGAATRPGSRRWRLTFDGGAGESAIVGAILAGRMPRIAVVEAEGGAQVAGGLPGSRLPESVLASLDDVLARVVTVVEAAVVEGRPDHADVAPLRHDGPDCPRVAMLGAAGIARAATRRLETLLRRGPRWKTGWRFVDGPDVMDLAAHPGTGWTELADDGARSYADPFPMVVAGRHWLFVGERSHRTGHGLISALPFDAAGPAGAPLPVLERSGHLSYPFVFHHRGEVWMVPNDGASRTVDLYRASRFPGGWVQEARLLEDVEAGDATLFPHGGRWWLTATLRDGGSPSDALHLWTAESPLGPWRPHPANPVLVDASAARPAGRVVSRGGRLIRPVQDRSAGPAGALGLAEITTLDETTYRQRLVGRLAPAPLWGGRSLGVLNRAGRLECIDGSTQAGGRTRPSSRFSRQSGADRDVPSLHAT